MFDVGSSNSTTLATNLTRTMSQTPITPTNEKRRNYRFCSGDPAIHPAEKRSYANGDYEGTPLHLSGCSDPRDGTRSDRAYYDLPVPQFKLDRSWVGAIPAKEVTFRNLNDNITKTLLADMGKRFGEIDDCKIYFDRHTKKHLGLGTVIFKTTKAARECVKALHMTTNMGSVISVSLETAGQERMKQYASITRGQEQDKAAQEKALAASAAASPPPLPTDSIVSKPSEKPSTLTPVSTPPVTHKITSNYSQPPIPYVSQNVYRTSSTTSSTMAHQSSSKHDSKGHNTLNDNSDQFSFDPYASFGGNSNSYKSSHRNHHRHHYSRQPPQQQQQQRSRRRRTSSSSTSSSSSRSSSSSSSSTSSSSSRSHSSTSTSSRSSYSSTRSNNNNNNTKKTNSGNDSRNVSNPISTIKKHNDDDDERPSLDARIAAIFRQQQQQTTPSPSSSSKTHHRPLPQPSGPPPSLFSYPPPPIPTSLSTSGHHHHQQSYGVVNNFNFFGNSFPPASFLNPTGGTNWQDMFKQPPPSNNQSQNNHHHHHHPTKYPSTGGLQPHLNDGPDERERKTNDLTAAVSNIVTGELVELLRKDLAKKLIETLVYKSIETWYDNEERKDKIRKIKLAESSTSTNEQPPSEQSTISSFYNLHHSTSNPLFERIPDESPSPSTSAPPLLVTPSSSNISTRMGDSLSAYFEQMKDTTGGQSVRAQMPKIPSFKKRTIPDEKPNAPPTPTTPLPTSSIKEKKQVHHHHHHHSRKKFRKHVSSSSSRSSSSSDNDDSQSRDSVVVPDDGSTRTSEVITTNKTIADLLSTTATTEEEEGEIKDDEDDEGSHPAETLPPPPAPPLPPLPPSSSESSKPLKKSATKRPATIKQNKTSVSVKKRKVEPMQEEDELTLAKRKKSVTSFVEINNSTDDNKKLIDSQLIQTFNLLADLPEQQLQSKPYDPFDYIRFEHDYAIVAKQPIPVAKRLTVNGLHDMGIYPPSQLSIQMPSIVKITPKFPSREHEIEMRIMYELDNGVDEEDMSYLKQSFHMLSDERHSCTIKTRWVDHPPSRDSPFVKQLSEKHRTGCARTEGFYKLANEEKVRRLKGSDDSQISSAIPQVVLDTSRTSGSQISRGLRSENRRNLAALGDVEFADHFKFSQLKLRKKRLRYAKSDIHAWGLFACEPITMEDMVIEYVGETIRQTVGDLREKQYEVEGIDSNYMFRVDSDTIVDATKCGNLARFINHSCDPNCYAKIIPVESQKKIVIYSKRDIRLGEEITYDYKFPLEDQKIPCRCRAPTCRGSLN